jgi:hypothetical protein
MIEANCLPEVQIRPAAVALATHAAKGSALPWASQCSCEGSLLAVQRRHMYRA